MKYTMQEWEQDLDSETFDLYMQKVNEPEDKIHLEDEKKKYPFKTRECGRIRKANYKRKYFKKVENSTASFSFYILWKVYKSDLKQNEKGQIRIVRSKGFVPSQGRMRSDKKISNKKIRKLPNNMISLKGRGMYRGILRRD